MAHTHGIHQVKAEDKLDSFFKTLKQLGFHPSLIFDIGANRGNWTRTTMRHFPDAQYVLYEPQTHLKNKISDNVTWRGVGILDEQGTAEFSSNERDDTSNFRPDATGRKSSIPVSSIDHECLMFGVPDLIKVDAEGMDLKVLKGATSALGKTEVFLVETSLCAPLENSLAAISSFMEGHGYRPVQITDLNESPNHGLLWLIELCFVHHTSSLLQKARWY